jgi:hypothetical protein
VEDGVFAANTFSCPTLFFPGEGKRDQLADCFGFGPGGLAGYKPIVANILKGLPSISVTVT